MTIHEMIAELDTPDHIYLRLKTIKAIKEALWAGQDMRAAWEDLRKTEGFYSPNSCKAWDAATKEDV